MSTKFLVSMSAQAFYPANTNPQSLPGDAKPIDDSLHDSFMPPPVGKEIDWSGDLPALADAPPPTAAQLWDGHRVSAQAMLTKSDTTLLRCLEHGIAVPPEWQAYRTALRAIVSASSGDPTQALPTRPAYPAGT